MAQEKEVEKMTEGTHNFLVKTKGWLLSAGTYADVQARADWYTWTANQRFAWAERTKIELTGIAAAREVIFPMGWSIQEIGPPEGYCYGTYNIPFVEDPATISNGMPWYCEIHDVWSTQEISNDDLDMFAGRVTNQQYGPSMEANAQVPADMPYKDWEMVVAARSRVWAPLMAPLDYGGFKGQSQALSAYARQQFDVLTHDNTWGSGEPIASLDLYHVRLYITCIDTKAPSLINDLTGTYCQMPSSLQPMAVQIAKPDFLSRMTMERRSKGI